CGTGVSPVVFTVRNGVSEPLFSLLPRAARHFEFACQPDRISDRPCAGGAPPDVVERPRFKAKPRKPSIRWDKTGEQVPRGFTGIHAMYETVSCPRHARLDRKDQAIGRILRLLPTLSVKELDALADRLRQRVHRLSDVGSSPVDPVGPVKGHDSCRGAQATTDAQLRIDLVGT
ncbi:MAG: hypothetical protein JXQ75_11630, partial [Phycisphaerae bacterium]|nr:hypothetical protein [Phycisphaerae bacterium]